MSAHTQGSLPGGRGETAGAAVARELDALHLGERVATAGRVLTYIVAGLPLVVFAAVLLVAGGATGLLLLPLWVGIPILSLTAEVGWRYAVAERWLANRLLCARIPPLHRPGPTGRLGVRATLRSAGLARPVVLLAVRLPAAVAAVAAALLTVALLAGLVALAVQGLAGGDGRFLGPVALRPLTAVALLVLAVPAGVVGLAALGALAGGLRHLAQALLAARAPAEGPVREVLAESLGDRSLAIAYWLPEREIFVDEQGERVEMPAPGSGRTWTSVDRGGRRVAAIVHDADLDAGPELVQAAAAGAALALDNEHLKADLRARLEELRASRARIVEAADEARRRLERDLHDGAQQQLVALALEMRLLKRKALGDGETTALVERASQKLAAALEELRELARGIHPAILTDRGLGPALQALTRRFPLEVDCGIDFEGRSSPAVEAAAYFVVTESLTNVAKYAHANEVRVRVEQVGDHLEVLVEDDGIGGADPSRGSGLGGLADRLGAVDGTLLVDSPPGRGTRVRARVPWRPALAETLGSGRGAAPPLDAPRAVPANGADATAPAPAQAQADLPGADGSGSAPGRST